MALRHHGFDVARGATPAPRRSPRSRDWRPHAIVLDVMLPDMEGFEVARRLAAQRAEVPILFLSARDNTADKVRGLTDRRRRLRDQAVQPGGAGRPAAQRSCAAAGAFDGDVRAGCAFADLELDEDTREVRRGGTRSS